MQKSPPGGYKKQEKIFCFLSPHPACARFFPVLRYNHHKVVEIFLPSPDRLQMGWPISSFNSLLRITLCSIDPLADYRLYVFPLYWQAVCCNARRLVIFSVFIFSVQKDLSPHPACGQKKPVIFCVWDVDVMVFLPSEVNLSCFWCLEQKGLFFAFFAKNKPPGGLVGIFGCF